MTAPEDTTSISVDRFIPHRPAEVWAILTSSEQMAKWLMPNTFRPLVGHEFTLWNTPRESVSWEGAAQCKVLELAEPTFLKISWADPGTENGLDSTVSWTLVPEGHGTRLLIDHYGFDPNSPVQQRTRRLMSGGWNSWVSRRLAELTDEVSPAKPSTPETTKPINDQQH